MQAHGTAIDVVADNIANVSTPGFKAAHAQFQALVAQTLRSASGPSDGSLNPMQVGLGVRTGAIEHDMSQGSPESTGRSSDLTIEGNGFFITQKDGVQRYTRNGAMDINGDRVLVETGNGAAVLGWTADSTGAINTQQTPATLKLPSAGETMARATSQMALGGNLNASAAVGDSATTQLSLYDSLGREQVLDITFTKTGDNAWSWAAQDSGGAAVGGGNVTFDANGLTSAAPQTLNVALAGGAAPLSVAVHFDGIRQLQGNSEVALTSQDGLAPGRYEGFSVSENGALIGSFSNGLTRKLGQLAVATFDNPAGLERDNSDFAATANSGNAQIGVAGSGGNGSIISGTLEMSNVDLTREFSKLITLQRGFQANGRSVTTSDQMLQDILSLKQ